MKVFKTLALVIFIVAAFKIGKLLYMKPSFGDGEIAPSFSGSMTDGNEFILEDLTGQYILLDFWGSWCGPCRVDFPHLRKLNTTFKGKKFKDAKGFEIVGVGIEKDKKRWLKTIQAQKLDWQYHVIDFNTDFKFFNSPIAGKYGVKEVPTKFFIAPNGQILGVNWPIEKVEAYLLDKML